MVDSDTLPNVEVRATTMTHPRRRWIGLLAVLALAPTSARAYWDDVHYQLTYFLAREAGYTPLQAYRLAAADSSTDWNSATEPVQGQDPTEANQSPRWRFHAFRNAFGATTPVIGFGTGTEQLDALVVGQRSVLLEQGVRDLNPGIWLHFYQDELPHLGFGSAWGHYPLTDAAVDEAEKAELKIGGAVDFLTAFPEDRTRDLAIAWGNDLLAYLGRIAPEQAAKRGRAPDPGLVTRIVERLRDENPAPAALTREELMPYKAFYFAQEVFPKAGIAAPPIETERDKKFLMHLKGPDQDRATRVVAAAMSIAGMIETNGGAIGLPPYQAARSEYRFDGYGNFVPTARAGVDEYVLTGTLAVKVAQSLGGPDGKPLDVTLRMAPTMKGEEEVDLIIKVGVQPGTTVEFEHVPVGEVVVEGSRDGKRVARHEGIRLVSRRREVSLGSKCFTLQEAQPMLGWKPDWEGATWKMAKDDPRTNPPGSAVRQETLGSFPMRSIPRAGSLEIHYDEPTPPTPMEADVTITEKQVTARVTERPDKLPVRTFTFTIDLPNRPPDEVCDGDTFSLPMLGRAEMKAAPDNGSASKLQVRFFNWLAKVSTANPGRVFELVVGGIPPDPWIASLEKDAQVDGRLDSVVSPSPLTYQFELGHWMHFWLSYLYDPPSTDASAPGSSGTAPPSPTGGTPPSPGSGVNAPPPAPAAPSSGAGGSPAFFRLDGAPSLASAPASPPGPVSRPVPPPAAVPEATPSAPRAASVAAPPSPTTPLDREQPAMNPVRQPNRAPGACENPLPSGFPARAAAFGCATAPAMEMTSSKGTAATWVRFEGRAIVLHRTGPLAGRGFELRGKELALYEQLGGPSSWLGLPISDPIVTAIGERGDFEGGSVVWGSGPEDAKAAPLGGAKGR